MKKAMWRVSPDTLLLVMPGCEECSIALNSFSAHHATFTFGHWGQVGEETLTVRYRHRGSKRVPLTLYEGYAPMYAEIEKFGLALMRALRGNKPDTPIYFYGDRSYLYELSADSIVFDPDGLPQRVCLTPELMTTEHRDSKIEDLMHCRYALLADLIWKGLLEPFQPELELAS